MKFAVHESESLAFVRSLQDASVDCVVTDPPYGLGKEPDALAMLRDWMTTGHHDHKGGGGFMGKKWDAFVPQPAFWAECLRVMKPGAHLVTFGGTRTFDLVMLGLRIAGFEVRDVLAWMYGSGFPKSHNLENEWEGWGTALKPAWEPVVLARKPLAGTVAENVQRFGVGAINISECRIPNAELDVEGRWPANVVLDEAAGAVLDEQSGEIISRESGYDFRLSGNSNSSHIVTNIKSGIHYGDAGGASRFFYCAKASRSEREAGLGGFELRDGGIKNDSGRGYSERDPYAAIKVANHHPTVKPIALMRWLVRLVTPTGGTVHDFFTGSGTTGCAAMLEGFDFTGCDREADYVEIARARIEFWRKASPSHVQAEFGEFTEVGR